ncbi:hypothetical protein CLV89_109115 [Tritonibacter scottomollicae]|uniref:Uncharacterized protein n=1 Tax=Tritonibacter scottomollicae TaxID=483013 RepID=A0A2T1ADM7_TRISK|nr:hypothetical protein CLV89_109115 [Tritonibacter scottomollicae]
MSWNKGINQGPKAMLREGRSFGILYSSLDFMRKSIFRTGSDLKILYKATGTAIHRQLVK